MHIACNSRWKRNGQAKLWQRPYIYASMPDSMQAHTRAQSIVISGRFSFYQPAIFSLVENNQKIIHADVCLRGWPWPRPRPPPFMVYRYIVLWSCTFIVLPGLRPTTDTIAGLCKLHPHTLAPTHCDTFFRLRPFSLVRKRRTVAQSNSRFSRPRCLCVRACAYAYGK